MKFRADYSINKIEDYIIVTGETKQECTEKINRIVSKLNIDDSSLKIYEIT